MMDTNYQQKLLTEKLTDIYKNQGYITEDYLYSVIEETDLGIDEIDTFVDHLLSIGIIIRDDVDDEIDEDTYDRSKIDYEVVFREVIEADPSLKTFVDKVRNIKPPQNREWQNLIPQAKNNNKYAKERVIEMYLKVVVKIAYSFHKRYDLPLAETIQDGCIGLVIALDKFEVGKQDKFSTYAPWWVRQNILRRAQVLNPQIYVPVHVKDTLFSIYDILKDFCLHEYDCTKIDEELLTAVSKKIGCSKEEAEVYLSYLNAFLSIDELMEEKELDFSDKSIFEEDMLHNVNISELNKQFGVMFNIFNEREKKVIISRFGFDDGREKTLEEVGNIQGVTRERIRQIEANALRKLKQPKRVKVLIKYVE